MKKSITTLLSLLALTLTERLSVTLRPSVGSFNLPCKSHYYITDDKVEWL